MSNLSVQVWRVALGCSGLLLLAGGPQHPDGNTDLDFYSSTALMLRDSGWVPSHALMLAGFVVLLLGLVLLLRSGDVAGRLATVAKIAIPCVALATVEMAFHLASVVDVSSLEEGGSTPILDTHIAMATVAYPLLGGSLVALAWFGGLGRVLVHPLLGVIGVIGGVMYGISAPLVVATHNQEFSFLFMGAIGIAIWLIAVGVGAFLPLIRGAPVRA